MSWLANPPIKFGALPKVIYKTYKEAVFPLSLLRPHKGNRWVALPAGMVKINVDKATLENGRNSSVGVIIRDS